MSSTMNQIKQTTRDTIISSSSSSVAKIRKQGNTRNNDDVTSTPSLIEEHSINHKAQFQNKNVDNDDEANEEMEQIFENKQHHFNINNSNDDLDTPKAMMKNQLRRTPGANTMHRSAFEHLKTQSSSATTTTSGAGQQTNTPSMRRTPGASAMHRSRAYQDEGSPLVLSTPMPSRSSTQPSEGKSTPSSSRTPRFQNSSVMMGNNGGTSSYVKPPLPKHNNGVRDNNYLYTPAGVALARNKNLNLPTPRTGGSFSPNTFQLATAIDDLLDDEDEDSMDNEIFPNINGITNSSITHNETAPQLQKTSSFGAESNISGVSSCLSCDSMDSFTLDSSKEHRSRSLILSMDNNRSNNDTSSRLHQSFVNSQFRALDNSYSSDTSNAMNLSESPRNKSMKSVSMVPSGHGAFSPPRQSHSRDDSETPLHVPTPKKAFQQSRTRENHSTTTSGMEANIGPLPNQQYHHYQQQHHHHNVISSHYADTHSQQGIYNMGYDANPYQYQHTHHQQHQMHNHHHPSHQTMPFQHQSHMMNNTQMEYLNHLQHVQHHGESPLTIPPSMSPLTIPVYHESSPIPFMTHPSNLGWSEADNQWGAMESGWDHNSQNQNFVNHFNNTSNNMYGRNFSHIHTPSPPPPHALPLYYGSNQSIAGDSYHNNSNQMYHPHEAINNQQSWNLDQFQAGSKQRNQNKKRFEKSENEMSVTSKENRKIVPNLYRYDNSNGVSHNFEERKVMKTKVFSKSGKASSDIVDVSNSKGKRIPPEKKKSVREINTHRKNKEHQLKTKTGVKAQIEDNVELTSEEKAAELKRSELVETPAIKSMFKEFYREYRIKEKISLRAAAKFATDCLLSEEFPTTVHWRIYLELADLSKRDNKLEVARELFHQVCIMQPYASQAWLEYSKLEEECGNLTMCSQILAEGLKYCENNEHLLIRAIKYEEKLAQEEGHNDLHRARELLASLKDFGVDKMWKVLLEGALMEARAGHICEARQILKFLMHHVPWYGPLYLEAFVLERNSDHPHDALQIVERGLKEIPRYGPLWFGAFRLCEGLDMGNNDFHLPRTLEMIERATKSISRELIWKVHLEAAQSLERAAHFATEQDKNLSLSKALSESRKRFVMTIASCPENLRWKVWLAAGRMELTAGRSLQARKIFLKSYEVVPGKGKALVLLECARLEEFVGNTKLANAILCKSRSEEGSDWKVWLQSVNLSLRHGHHDEAISLAIQGLQLHSGTGRLWSALVQLRAKDSNESQMKALKQALHAVPKSGEVWCEAARIFLNPLSTQFDLETALQHLEFATKFTPQYGDSFIETLRLLLVHDFIFSKCQSYIDQMKTQLEKCLEEDNDTISDDRGVASFQHILASCIQKTAHTIKSDRTMTLSNILSGLDTSTLELKCSNADPNYGKLWFHCRVRPSDTARVVMKRAKDVIGHNLERYGYLYVTAAMRRIAIEMLIQNDLYNNIVDSSDEETKDVVIDEDRTREKWMEKVPSLESLLLHEGGYMIRNDNNDNNKTNRTKEGDEREDDMVLLERGISISNFITGIFELNEEVNLQDLSLMERRKILFGSDLLL